MDSRSDTIRKAKLRQPTGQRLSNVRMQQKKINLTLFLYYEESLVSSNLNSNQLRFHGVRPNYFRRLVSYHEFNNVFTFIELLM